VKIPGDRERQTVFKPFAALFFSPFSRHGFENGKGKPCSGIAAYPLLAAARRCRVFRAAAARRSLSERLLNSDKEDKSMLFDNPYTLREESSEGIPRYFVSFADGEGIHRETEVSRIVYREFERFVRIERNLIRRNERHGTKFDVTEEMLRANMVKQPKSLEDEVFDSQRDERLRLAIRQLPEIQRRRFVLYHEFGLTYGQIAEMEGCTKMAVKFSVDLAKAKIREEIKDF
jgi:RNA polymerase sigma-70 factor (ECF subfamily)